ncbi:hypothetical protein CRUP_012860 [Coryphaenoides rupestris]|nr:hypothetical protein CRUP_012860 [Coryphaenoides rupestris]
MPGSARSPPQSREHLKPPVTRLLLSSELYCRAYALLLADAPPPPEDAPPPPPQDGTALLRLLARRGPPPTDHMAPVTEDDLRRKPIKMQTSPECVLWRFHVNRSSLHLALL